MVRVIDLAHNQCSLYAWNVLPFLSSAIHSQWRYHSGVGQQWEANADAWSWTTEVTLSILFLLLLIGWLDTFGWNFGGCGGENQEFVCFADFRLNSMYVFVFFPCKNNNNNNHSFMCILCTTHMCVVQGLGVSCTVWNLSTWHLMRFTSLKIGILHIFSLLALRWAFLYCMSAGSLLLVSIEELHLWQLGWLSWCVGKGLPRAQLTFPMGCSD